MAGRFFDFGNPLGHSSDPWFKVGTLDVTTTVAIVAAGVISMFVWAAEGLSRSVSKNLWLVSENGFTGSVVTGQVWRLITWPIPNEPSIWTVLLFAIFFIFGSQVERVMGRKPFMWFVICLAVIPALIVTILEILTGLDGFAAGLDAMELGIIAAWAAQYPTARFFGLIPAPIGVAVFVGIDVLQSLGTRPVNNFHMVIVLTTVAVALVGIRSFGHATDAPQIPKVPLPSFMTGQAQPRSARSARPQRAPKSRRTRGKGKGKLRSVPPPAAGGGGNTNYRSSAAADQEMDSLLDQVADQGYDSLSKEQKKRLQEHSKRLREGRDE